MRYLGMDPGLGFYFVCYLRLLRQLTKYKEGLQIRQWFHINANYLIFKIIVLGYIRDMGFPGGSVVRICLQHRRLRSDPGSGRSPGERNGKPLQDSCLENSMDRGAWRAIQSIGSQSWTKMTQHACMHALGLSCSMQNLLVAACRFLVAACGIQFHNWGWNLGPLNWEHRVLSTGPPEKSHKLF